jgi:HPr Serine kinase C-terminal domain
LYQYQAYGLGFHSEIALPELVASDIQADVIVKLSPKDTKLIYSKPDQSITYPKVSPLETIFVVKNLGAFQVKEGKEIWITPAPNADLRVIQLCVSGSVMAILLYQRGYQALHAGAVNIAGQAVAFVGESGQGKSSMTVTLLSRGHQLVADDIVPIDFKNGRINTIPGYPQTKIGLELAEMLGFSTNSLIFLHPQLGKYAYRQEQNFSPSPLPLHSIYVLDEGDTIQIERLSAQTAIVELIRHSYGSRALQAAVSPGFHLLQSTEIYKRVPIYRLQRPRSLPLLPEIAQLIEQNVNKNLTPVLA